MFAGGSFGVGIGYQFTDDGNEFVAGKPGRCRHRPFRSTWRSTSGLSAAVNYMIDPGRRRQQRRRTTWASACGYTFDADDPARQLRSLRLGRGRGCRPAAGYGLSAAYDFGGGLSAHLGYGWGEVDRAQQRQLVSPNPALRQHLVLRPEHVLLIQPDHSETERAGLAPALFLFGIRR
jgi:hypothetical protein